RWCGDPPRPDSLQVAASLAAAESAPIRLQCGDAAPRCGVAALRPGRKERPSLPVVGTPSGAPRLRSRWTPGPSITRSVIEAGMSLITNTLLPGLALNAPALAESMPSETRPNRSEAPPEFARLIQMTSSFL